MFLDTVLILKFGGIFTEAQVSYIDIVIYKIFSLIFQTIVLNAVERILNEKSVLAHTDDFIIYVDYLQRFLNSAWIFMTN